MASIVAVAMPKNPSQITSEGIQPCSTAGVKKSKNAIGFPPS